MHPTSTLMGFIPTTDAARAQTFFCQTLGLTLVEDNGFAVILRSGGKTVRLVRIEAFEPFPFTLLGWEVEDLPTEVQTLTRKGVVFERYPWFEQDAQAIWTAPSGARVAWFKDPDGNTLSLSQQER